MRPELQQALGGLRRGCSRSRPVEKHTDFRVHLILEKINESANSDGLPIWRRNTQGETGRWGGMEGVWGRVGHSVQQNENT